MNTKSPVLEIRNLHKSFGKIKAVAGINLKIYAGQCFGLLGPNGAGKSTAIEIMEGIKKPTSGEVLYEGKPLDKNFRQQAGIMFQSTALPSFITVEETLKMFHRLYENVSSLKEIIRKCQIGEFLDHETTKISGGQKQRLLLALALINRPKILFLDEPTTGLDPQARHNLWKIVEDIKKQGNTVVLTTHYMEEAHELCDEIAIMDHGKIIASGLPNELLATYFSEVVVDLPKKDISAAYLKKLPHTESKNVVHIVTDDINKLMTGLIKNKVPLENLRVRERNLEDLFLELTGKELRS